MGVTADLTDPRHPGEKSVVSKFDTTLFLWREESDSILGIRVKTGLRRLSGGRPPGGASGGEDAGKKRAPAEP